MTLSAPCCHQLANVPRSHFDRRTAVAGRRVVVIATRLQLDVSALGNPAIRFDVDFDGPASQREDVDQVPACPGLDVETIDAAALQASRHARGQEDRSASTSGDLERHFADLANESGDVVAQLPLSARRQARHMSGEIQLEPVQRIGLGQMPQQVDLVAAHALDRQIPQPVRPPGLQHPIGMRLPSADAACLPTRSSPAAGRSTSLMRWFQNTSSPRLRVSSTSRATMSVSLSGQR